VLNNLGWGELMMLLLVGLLVFGPDQLPKIAADLGRMLRQLRRMAKDVSSDLRSELGPEFEGMDITSMHPKAFIAKHMMAADDDDDTPGPPRRRATGNGRAATGGAGAAQGTAAPSADRPAAAAVEAPPYDADAT
jgi:sec-independent protein translocase protein TatB